MEFFKNKIVKIIAWVLLAICCAVLIIGGTATETIASGVVMTAAIVSAVSALVAFICERVK